VKDYDYINHWSISYRKNTAGTTDARKVPLSFNESPERAIRIQPGVSPKGVTPG